MLLLCSLLLLATAALWLRRVWRALETLRKVPQVSGLYRSIHAQRPPLKVSVLIPARNEEKNLAVSLPSLIQQSGIDWECLVANDRSTDHTEKVLKNFGFMEAVTAPAGTRTRYVNIQTPGPAAWTGKNYALSQLAPHATGDWFLFTDADTLHESSSIRSAVVHAENDGLDFLTLLPRCIASTHLERTIQPLAMSIMGLWFPLSRVNSMKDPLYFANGQFLLIRRSLYEKLGGHTAVAHEFLEDFALMRKAKESGAACGCHFGQQLYGTRMYKGLREIWHGWRRIYRHAAQDSISTLLLWLAGLGLGSLLPLILIGMLLSKQTALSGLGLAAWGLALINLGLLWGTVLKTHRVLRTQGRYAFFHPLAALVVGGILIDAVRIIFFKRNTKWRE